MRNQENWKPSKFIFKNGELIASRNQQEVAFGSRLFVDINANYYSIYIKKYCKGNLIDLGCGKAPLYGLYKQYSKHIVCVDRKNSIHGNDYVDIISDLANNLPVKEAKFNSIVLSDVLEHIPQPDVLWKEMHRILEKGGRIFLNVPFYYRLHEIPYDFYRYTEYALHRLAEFQGFKIIFLESIGGLPEIMADLFSKAVNNIPMLGRYLSVAIQNLTIVFLKTKLGHNISLKTKKIFPLGYFMIVEKI